MKSVIVIVAAVALGGCGVETASTAATAAALKKQELEQGKKTLDQAQQKVQGAVGRMPQRGETSDR